MKNLELYNKFAEVPEWAKKEIKAGRTKGMTDINPQWRIKCLTEQFGVCGIGWKVVIKNKWIETGEHEKSAFVEIELFVKVDDVWSEGIPAMGGSSFIAMEKVKNYDGSPTNEKVAYQSDECYKMAYTDALSVACKLLGIGSNIYSGSKYITVLKEEQEAVQKNINLDDAIESMKKAKDRTEMAKIWNANKAFHTNEQFLTAMAEIGKNYPKTEKLQ